MQRETIVGYAPAFKRDRRMWSIPTGMKDQHGQMVNKPLSDFGINHGIPLWSVGYFLAAVALSFLLTSLPIVSIIFGQLPWPLIHIALPLLLAWWLSGMEPDGRPVLRHVEARVRHIMSAKDKSAGRPIRPRDAETTCDAVTVVTTSRRS